MIFGIATEIGSEGTWQLYVKACIELKYEYRVVDITSSKWLENIREAANYIDGLLVRPPCMNLEHYDIYMERVYFINHEMKIPIYPSYDALKLYENKRYCTTWLKYYGYPHPKTFVFTDRKEAINFLKDSSYPIVIKASIGAGASAVHIIKNFTRATLIINRIFGPHKLLSRGYISWVKYKNIIPVPLIGSSLKHYVIIQEYIPIKWEWRIIKIGESYFGHQKLLRGKYASGSGKVGWVMPPFELLDLIRDICDKGKFESMAMDVLESVDGKYYINELQTLFGSYLDSQMFINGNPGRFIYDKDSKEYIFEQGYFNKYGSNLLRVKHFYELLSSSYYNEE